MGFATKVYVVQLADRDGNLGDVVGVKLTHGPAHALARRLAPATVHFVIADKTELANASEHADDQDGEDCLRNVDGRLVSARP